MPSEKPLYVTRPTLPPLDEMMPLFAEMWESRMLSNHGPIHRRFEVALAQYLGVEHLSLVANATLGLIVALRHLGVTGEVLTTPFSFVATSHSIRLAGAEPVFADIDPITLNLDPAAAERAITPRTQAILATHCYGTPCDLGGLDALAARHGIPLIYDAAHAFAVRADGRTILHHGDFSVLSFHATKVFHTLEGGAVICRDRETKIAIDRLCNHGIDDETTVSVVGMNAKMSEVHAAFGLAQLNRVDGDIAARGEVAGRYWQALHGINGLRCVCPPDRPGQNYYAFPILVGPGYPLSRDDLYFRLRDDGIFARRYFYPLISEFPMYSGLASAELDGLPIAKDAADQVLCLPIFPDLDPADQQRVIDIVAAP